jgi:hypothetical protein
MGGVHMYSMEQIKSNLNIDRQLQVMIYEQLVIQNDLLRTLFNGNNQVNSTPVIDINDSQEDIDSLKRPELMKRIAKLSNKPQGWNKWETEDMRKHLKGAS